MIFVLDTETTDSELPNGEVIELAFIAGRDLSDILSDSGTCQTFRFCPERQSTYGAVSTHHIIPDELVGCLPSSTAEIPADCEYLIGHNIDFDWKMLGSPSGIKRIDTLAMMRHLHPEMDSHRLGACMYFLLGQTASTRDMLRHAHSADADISFCIEILKYVCKRQGITDIESLYAFSEHARIPTVMSFGKHKGEPVSDVPYGYIKWYRSQSDTDPYLLEAFRRVTDAQYKGR